MKPGPGCPKLGGLPVRNHCDGPAQLPRAPDIVPAAKVEITRMTKLTEEQIAEWEQIEIGDQVKHPKWGVGTVLFRSGSGMTAKAIVVFPEEGQKKLMLRYAKLKKVGSTSLKSVERLKAEISAPKPKAKAKAKPKAPAKPEASGPEAPAEEEVSLDLDDIVEEDEKLAIEDEETEVVGFDKDETDDFSKKDEKSKTES